MSIGSDLIGKSENITLQIIFETLYTYAVKLIEKGKAYVCDLTPEETRTYRGTLVEPGKNSPYRDRSIEENLTLFQGMRDGEFSRRFAYTSGKN